MRGKRRYEPVFDLYVTLPALLFADCYHVALMESQGLSDLTELRSRDGSGPPPLPAENRMPAVRSAD
jgi:hypothetical protein